MVGKDVCYCGANERYLYMKKGQSRLLRRLQSCWNAVLRGSFAVAVRFDGAEVGVEAVRWDHVASFTRRDVYKNIMLLQASRIGL